jgi:hypothetical protein
VKVNRERLAQCIAVSRRSVELADGVDTSLLSAGHMAALGSAVFMVALADDLAEARALLEAIREHGRLPAALAADTDAFLERTL